MSYLFVLVYFFLLLEAMNESALDKLRRKTREKELERKVEATMKK
jgi:hypothetical protein